MWWNSSGPSNIKPVPFLHPDVILHLENLIQPEWRILEHGSGGSTLWFAERCHDVTAFESNKRWYDALRHKANQKIYLVMFVGTLKDCLVVDKKFDLLLIDGEPLEARALFLMAAYELVKPGGIVVLDNANREIYAKERLWLQKNCQRFETFDCNDGVSQYLVTEFYYLKG